LRRLDAQRIQTHKKARSGITNPGIKRQLKSGINPKLKPLIIPPIKPIVEPKRLWLADAADSRESGRPCPRPKSRRHSCRRRAPSAVRCEILFWVLLGGLCAFVPRRRRPPPHGRPPKDGRLPVRTAPEASIDRLSRILASMTQPPCHTKGTRLAVLHPFKRRFTWMRYAIFYGCLI